MNHTKSINSPEMGLFADGSHYSCARVLINFGVWITRLNKNIGGNMKGINALFWIPQVGL